MKKVRKRKMFIIIGVFLVVITAILVWFKIPYSPIKRAFRNDIDALISKSVINTSEEIFTASDFSHLPAAVQKYIENCGYIGTPKMSYMKMEYEDVAFVQGRSGPALTIDYEQYDFVKQPARMALIDSSLFGVPFEGYDYYQNGKGGMKGVIAKAFTIFDQTGADMDKACLVTFLAESLFVPTILMQNYVEWTEISEYETQATIVFDGVSASGIFTFDENYEMISFTTNDRSVAGTDGTVEYMPWSALCSDYRFTESGILHPTKFKAVWHYPNEDFIYFDGIINEISYDYS